MADKRIQDLTPASSVGLADRFVLEQSGQAKSLTGQVLITDLAAALDGHGGISGVSYTPPVAPSLNGTLTITLADNTSYDVTVTNGNGISSVAVAYGISTSGTDPSLVSEWSNTVVPPTDANPYMWTRITLAYIDGNSTVAYSVTAKADDPSISVGSVSASSGVAADVEITNSGTTLNPVLDFDFTLPKGDKGDTGDYIEPVVSYGTSTAAATEPTTWYSSPSSISYAAGNYIWRKTDYTLHDAQTVQSTKKEIIGYIGQNGSGSGTVTQITFNGDVFSDDGTGNVPMTVDAEDVGAIADPSTKSDGQVLTWDSNANAWVAANPATGNVNTVNNIGVTAGTTNIDITGANIPVSGSDNTPISSALSAVKPISEGGTGATDAVAALLNLKGFDLTKGTEIPDNSNLNNYTTEGVYYVSSSTHAATILNTPLTDSGFRLIVQSDGLSNYYHQWILPNNSKTFYARVRNASTWSAWARYLSSDELPLSVENGGTGATTAAAARTSLGAVAKAGDTMTGNLYVAKAGNAYVQAENSVTGAKLNFDSGSSQYHGIYTYGYYDGSSFHSDPKWMIYRGGDGIIRVNGKAENVTGTVAVANGGTGATTAAAARTNIGAAPAPTIVNKSTTSSSASAITAEYTVSGSGTVIVYAGIYSDTTSDYGTWQAEIYYDGTLIMGEGTRLTTDNSQRYGASTSVPVEVTNGKKIKITLLCTKTGTKSIFRRFLCFGCTVS